MNAACILSMLYFGGINVSEGIDVNKTSASEEYDVCIRNMMLRIIFKLAQANKLGIPLV